MIQKIDRPEQKEEIARKILENLPYMQVKTVREGCYKEYDKTISFYKRMGFKEFECFPTLWDEWNPCQIYVMNIE